MNVISNFEMIDIDILVEYNLYAIIFAKEKLRLDDEKTTLLTNLLYSLVSNNSEVHWVKSDKLGPQEIKAEEYIHSLYKNKDVDPFDEENSKLEIREKTLSSDIDYFSIAIRRHCVNNPPDEEAIFTSR